MSVSAEDLRSLCGLDEKNSKDLATKQDRAQDLVAFFNSLDVKPDADRAVKVSLYAVWSKAKAHRDYVGKAVVDRRLVSSAQVDAALKWVSTRKDINDADFDAECGVGVVVSREQIASLVAEQLKSQDPKALLASYTKNPGKILGEMKRVGGLKWADFTLVKEEIDTQVPALTAGVQADAPAAKPKAKPAAAATPAAANDEPEATWGMGKTPDEVRATAPRGSLTQLKDIAATAAGQVVVVQGWAHRVRHQSRMSFVVLRDTTGYVQVVFGGKIPNFARESSVVLRAKVVDEPKAARPMQPPKELHVEEWAMIGEADPDIENVITHDSSVDKLYDHRHLVLRGDHGAAIMQVRAALLQAFRQHFWSTNCLEMTPPTLVQTSCEGGSSLFELNYYGEKAYLTQSSQMYLETCLSSIGDVFCIVPSYRAEKTKTNRHLSEFTHAEAEYANITFEDLLGKLEDLVCDVFDRTIPMVGHLVAHMNKEELISPDADPRKPESWKFRPTKPMLRLKYADAIKYCNEHGILNPETEKPYEFGEDITDAPEREMVKKIGQPVLMTHFPADMKAFYMSRVKGDRTLTESVDVLMPGVGEIIGGSMRMDDLKELLVDGYEKNGLDPVAYQWYTDQRKYGTVPHGGFGLGVERFIKWILNLHSVKEACLFPRYMGRCQP